MQPKKTVNPKPLDWTMIPFVRGLFEPIQCILMKQGVRVVSRPLQSIRNIVCNGKQCMPPQNGGAHLSTDLQSGNPDTFHTCLSLAESISNPNLDHLRNVVYCIRCEQCRGIYLGQSGRALGLRKHEHATDVSKSKMSNAIAKHCEHNHIMDVSTTTIVYTEPIEKLRINLESYTIAVNEQRAVNVVKKIPFDGTLAKNFSRPSHEPHLRM